MPLATTPTRKLVAAKTELPAEEHSGPNAAGTEVEFAAANFGNGRASFFHVRDRLLGFAVPSARAKLSVGTLVCKKTAKYGSSYSWCAVCCGVAISVNVSLRSTALREGQQSHTVACGNLRAFVEGCGYSSLVAILPTDRRSLQKLVSLQHAIVPLSRSITEKNADVQTSLRTCARTAVPVGCCASTTTGRWGGAPTTPPRVVSVVDERHR